MCARQDSNLLPLGTKPALCPHELRALRPLKLQRCKQRTAWAGQVPTIVDRWVEIELGFVVVRNQAGSELHVGDGGVTNVREAPLGGPLAFSDNSDTADSRSSTESRIAS